MIKIKKIDFKKILNSGGKFTIETKITFKNGIYGVASSPSALTPGKREVCISDFDSEQVKKNILFLKKELINLKKIDQKKIDYILYKYIDYLGSDICLSISLAFARAMSKYYNISLVKYIEFLSEINSKHITPYPLVAIFSGGVHGTYEKNSLQQIMLSVNINNFNQAINIIIKIYNEIELYLKNNNKFVELGASSGFVVKNMTVEEQLKLLEETIKKHSNQVDVTIALDVAAEHLKQDNYYLYQGQKYTSIEFHNLIQNYRNKYNITFIEDPFDTTDIDTWSDFKKNNSDINIAGDDLFATQAKYINNAIANTTIIKMNQVGTLSHTIEAIKKAKQNNIKLCVSHRSLETEDTFMCDLAIATNSDFIKIGGPRRGDRICKYNRILELTEDNKIF